MTTSLPLDRQGTENFSISEIVDLAMGGLIRVPRFQRSFAWKTSDIRDLFDSLYRGFPVGTILLWRREAPASRIGFGPVQIDAPEVSSAYWVVDGQQRITTLVASLAGNGGLDPDFDVHFDLATQKFIQPRGGRVPPRAIPVREALETRSLLTWLRVHADDLDADDFDVADRLGGVLRDYRIPAYVVLGEDPELLREVFDRVNSAGQPIGRAEIFHALFASDTEPASAATVVEELSGLGFGTLDENRVVQSLLAIRGGNVQRDLHGEFASAEDPATWFDETERALSRAITFVRGQGVPHLALMPTTLPLPVLAAFFHVHPEPSPWVRRLLGRWLWRGWVHDFGRQAGQTPVLRRAVQTVIPRKLGYESAPGEYEAAEQLLQTVSDQPAPQPDLARFRTNSAPSRLVLLALVSRAPLRPNGEPVDVAAELEQHGTRAITDLVSGRRNDAAAQGFWPVDDLPFSPNVTDAVLASHVVGPLAAQALREGHVDVFLDHRRRDLQALVDDVLDNKLAIGTLVRPPLSEIIAGARRA